MPIRAICAAILTFFISLTIASAAPVVILSGEVDGQGPGSLVDDATAISLPAGAILMFNDATGQTRTLTGPYEGPIGADQTTGPAQTGLDRLIASREAEVSRLGAIRAAPGHAARNPDLISVAQTSVQCLQRDGVARLWRPTTLDADSHITITDIASGASRRLVWHGGGTLLNWPEGLEIGMGSAFRLDLDIAARPVVVTLHRAAETFDDDQELLTWMSSVGCRRQAFALMGRLAN